MSPPPIAAPRSALKRFAVIASTGALLGFVLFCVFGARAMVWWWYTPAKEAFSCGPLVSDALHEFVKLQLGAAVGGAVIVLILVALFRRLWTRITGSNAAPVPLAAIGPEGNAPLPPTAPPPGPKPESLG